jgi:single-strand DNA-binding protein
MLKVIAIGRLGKDPEIRTTNSGKDVANFSLACDITGSKDKKTEWINCVAFGKQAENIAKYLSKGDQVYIEGVNSSSSYENKQGNTVYKTDVITNVVQFIQVKSFQDNKQKFQSQSNFEGDVEFDPNEDIPF